MSAHDAHLQRHGAAALRPGAQVRTAAAQLWRLIDRAFGFVGASVALLLVVAGVYRDAAGSLNSPQMASALSLLALLGARLVQQGLRRRAAASWRGGELGLLLVALVFVVVELCGGPRGLCYPLIYGLVVALAVLQTTAVAAALVALILVTEVLTTLCRAYVRDAAVDGPLLVAHGMAVALLALLCMTALRASRRGRSRAMQKEIAAHLDALAQAAREFRLGALSGRSAQTLTQREVEQRRVKGSVECIQEALANLLRLAERALQVHTIALLWLDCEEKHWCWRAGYSRSNNLVRSPMALQEGFLGVILRQRDALTLTGLRPHHAGLVYYNEPEKITDFIGMPVLQSDKVCGLLVADRSDGVAFAPGDGALLRAVASEVARVVEVERLFADMDREQFQRERFYQASRAFNQTRSVREVAQVAIEASRWVTQADFAAVAVAVAGESSSSQMEIVAVDWPGHPEAGHFVGALFGADEGLVGAAMKARVVLPHGHERSSGQYLFSKRLDPSLKDTKVLPLLWKDAALGALVLGGGREACLPDDRLEMARVIADHAAISIANAQMYERMERMATTDGLTGLVNHRQFQVLADVAVARARRYGRRLSLILADVDYFKAVNDTYGHPMGDKVLERVARVLMESARRTDVVARYGGEEFAILMEETDHEGAGQIAERVRRAVANLIFEATAGRFSCTLSLGTATLPDDAGDKETLTQRADQALYAAKHLGRNQTVAFRAIHSRENPAHRRAG